MVSLEALHEHARKFGVYPKVGLFCGTPYDDFTLPENLIFLPSSSPEVSLPSRSKLLHEPALVSLPQPPWGNMNPEKSKPAIHAV